MEKFINVWIISYPSSLVFMFLGAWQLYDTITNTDRKQRGLIDPYFDGWVSGIGFLG